jgi:hypothetical protein
MRKSSILLTAFIIVLAGCQKTSKNDLSPSVQTGNALVNSAKADLMGFINTLQLPDRFARTGNQVTENSNERRVGAQNRLTNNADFNYNLFRVKRAINPDDYECGPTIIDEYINNSVANWTNDDFTIYFHLFFFDLGLCVIVSKLRRIWCSLFWRPRGVYECEQTYFRDLQNFWDIPGADIYLTAAHGDFFNDINKVTVILKKERELGWINPAITDAQIAQIAQLLQIVFGSDNFQNFKHPLLSFNAFAASPDAFF